MGWIADVVTRTTIRSVWGNTIRDHVVHTFDTLADLKASSVPKVGMMAYATDTATLYRWDGTGWAIIDEPWQTQAAPTLKGNAATSNGPDWTLVGTVTAAHYRLDPAGTTCRYKRQRDRVRFVGSYKVLDAAAPGTPTQVMLAVLPVAMLAGNAQPGAGGAYGSQSGYGEMGGPAYVNGAAALVVRAGSGTTVNIVATSPYWPWPADTFYVSVDYPTAVNYG